MKKVALVSCDKWINKIDEDMILKNALSDLGIETKIISWQQPVDGNYDALILRSVWGYQNDFEKFKNWLLYIKNNNILLLNNPDMILKNIMKNIQFEILKKNNINFINTMFLNLSNLKKIDLFDNKPYVIKPTISGSGENTYLVDEFNSNNTPNTLKKSDILKTYKAILEKNKDCMLMVQPFISNINDGEYSCIFIGGVLTHTLLRFPNVFHEKKKTYLVKKVPESIIQLAKKVEKIPEFNNYLYMRVDMVLVDNKPMIMEVELAEPDLLIKYIDDEDIKANAIRTFAKTIERRIR